MYWTVSLRFHPFPIVPGHEASGVVVNVGDEVGNVAPGDPVSLDPSFYCGDCSYAWSDAATSARTGTAPGWHDRTALPPSSSAGQPRTCIASQLVDLLGGADRTSVLRHSCLDLLPR